MRQYLIHFFERCDYDSADAAYLLDAYDRVAANSRAAALWAQALALYDENIGCDFSRVIALAGEAARAVGLHEYTTELLIFLCMSRRLEAEYAARGVDNAIFCDTVLDLKYKLDECKAVKGIVGSFVASWFGGFFNMTRFTLGRLQFEVVDFGRHYEKDGAVLTPESRVINVHIPRTGTPLDVAACDDAFARAKAFFAAQTGAVCAFVCHSWLLFPAHEQMLSHTSNTYHFMKRFDIFAEGVSKDREDLWRLFDTDEKRWDKLPADSSFRRAYVERLKNGGTVGWGHGVFIMK